MRNFVDFNFCKRNGITMSRLSSRLVLRLLDGSKPEKGVIDFSAQRPLRVNDTLYHVQCLVTRLDPSHPVVLGMTFLNDEFPHYVDQLKNIGKIESSGGSTDKTPPTLSVPASADRTDTAPSFLDERPIALPASRDPKAAFTAGGVIAAIEAEEHRRKASIQEAEALIRLRIGTVYRLEELEDTLAMCAASVNGLTPNADNWLETIPDFARRFATSVFSDASAKELPPSRPGLGYSLKLLLLIVVVAGWLCHLRSRCPQRTVSPCVSGSTDAEHN
jgi:hypothetical protein